LLMVVFDKIATADDLRPGTPPLGLFLGFLLKNAGKKFFKKILFFACNIYHSRVFITQIDIRGLL
jgi:hypothetical protein